jgi:adenylate cyclase
MQAWYDKSRKSLMIDGIHITGGAQALLLREIILLYKQSGRIEFDWRELATNKKLICSPKSTGLTTRMYRIIKCLEKSRVSLRIEKYGRGKFRLIIPNFLEFQDQ